MLTHGSPSLPATLRKVLTQVPEPGFVCIMFAWRVISCSIGGAVLSLCVWRRAIPTDTAHAVWAWHAPIRSARVPGMSRMSTVCEGPPGGECVRCSTRSATASRLCVHSTCVAALAHAVSWTWVAECRVDLQDAGGDRQSAEPSASTRAAGGSQGVPPPWRRTDATAHKRPGANSCCGSAPFDQLHPERYMFRMTSTPPLWHTCSACPTALRQLPPPCSSSATPTPHIPSALPP